MSDDARIPRDNLFRAVHPGVEVRAAAEDGGKPILFGYFARFNEWTEIDSMIEGHFMERFAPGAFKKTLTERTPKVLFQHGRDGVLNNQPIAKVVEIREDDEGAYYEAELFDGVPEIVLSGLREGVYGASFRFSALREDMEHTPARSDHNPDGITERTVREAMVPEFGPVTFPAYEGATAGVRSVTDEFFIQQLATQPDRLRRLIDWLDKDAPDGAREQDPPEPEPEAQDEEREDTAPPVETPDPESTSPQGRRETNSTPWVLPRAPKPRKKAGVLPNREQEGEQGWTPIRLP